MTKRCNNCGTDHDGNSWGELTAVGLQRIAGELQELRMCTCGSTLAIEVTLANAVDVFDRWIGDNQPVWSISGQSNWMRMSVRVIDPSGVERSWTCGYHSLRGAALKSLENAASVSRL